MNFQISWRLPISTQKKKKKEVCLNEVDKYNKIIFSEKASCNYINKHMKINTYQKTVKLLNQNRYYSQQTHADRKIRFFNWCWRRWSAGTLSEFYIWRKELYHKRTYSFFEEETKFLMLFAKIKKKRKKKKLIYFVLNAYKSLTVNNKLQ